MNVFIKTFDQFKSLFYLFVIFRDDDEFINFSYLREQLSNYCVYVGVLIFGFDNQAYKCFDLDELIDLYENKDFRF